MATGPQDRAALAMLAFQLDCGADEPIADSTQDRYRPPTLPQGGAAPLAATPPDGRAVRPPAGRVSARPGPPKALFSDTAAQLANRDLAEAQNLAASCTDLASLRTALAGFDGCALKRGAKSCVFADGNPAARLMVVGEAPGREEDQRGLPFVGRSGQLLDRMLGAIGLARDHPDPDRTVYITNVLPWRPPQNREPSSDEITMMKAFLLRHITLAQPDMLLLMGRSAASTLLETATGITRLRGRWHSVLDRPAMPTFHPAALLRNPLQKRQVWSDLLSLQDRLMQPA